MGDTDEFKRAVELVIENVSFDHCPTVQVFEASIRFAPAIRCTVDWENLSLFFFLIFGAKH